MKACLLAVALLSACGPPTEGACRPFAVEPPVPPPMVLLIGKTQIRVEAPRLSCLPPDPSRFFSVTIQLDGPGGTTTQSQAAFEPSIDPERPSLITGELEAPPGEWSARVIIEPAIAAFTAPVFSVHDRRSASPLIVDRPACAAVWFTTRGTQLCPALLGSVAVTSVDGGIASAFPALDVAVRGDVVWSTTPIGNQVLVERRVDGALGLQRTHRFVGVPGEPARWVDERFFWQGPVVAEALGDGGVQRTSVVLESPDAGFHFIDDGRAVEVIDERVCHLDTTDCWTEPTLGGRGVTAIGPTRVWRRLVVADQVAQPVVGLRRPIRPETAGRVEPAPGFLNWLPLTSPGWRGPGILVNSSTAFTLLERTDGTFEAWSVPPPASLIEATEQLLVVSSPSGRWTVHRR
jgi:hypothetical protein